MFSSYEALVPFLEFHFVTFRFISFFISPRASFRFRFVYFMEILMIHDLAFVIPYQIHALFPVEAKLLAS